VKAKPMFYATVFMDLKTIALEHGYNLLIHGSLNRDLDLVAIPWQEELKPIPDMIGKFCEYLGGTQVPTDKKQDEAFTKKFHGRQWFGINLNRGGERTNYEDPEWYLDISVVPPAA
jgi:hypothetical protein